MKRIICRTGKRAMRTRITEAHWRKGCFPRQWHHVGAPKAPQPLPRGMVLVSRVCSNHFVW